MNSAFDISPSSIVVLGNGFDLKCGLHSSFRHFYEKEIRGKKENSNLWYLLFKFSYYYNTTDRVIPFIGKLDIRWMDIEGLIKDVATERKFKRGEVFTTFVSLSYIDVLIESYKNAYKSLYLYENSEIVMFKDFFIHNSPKNVSLDNKNTMFKFLYEELLKFEEDFSLYISKEVKKEGYVDNVSKLLTNLLGGEEHFYLLNFNYTTFSYMDIASFVAYDDINNVHGAANNDSKGIVIGFDSSDHSTNENNNNSLLLSKVYQKINLGIDSPAFPKTIRKIKFYGHSLGEQDYSYFQSLFDMYNIAESEVILEFYYSRHGNTKEEIADNESKYRLRIINLLEDYSTRKGSKTKNLASTLNFQSRLITKEIDF